MIIQLNKFGTVLVSRPAGKEAYLSAKAYTLPKNNAEPIEIDFAGVHVLSPSWADEFITPLKKEFSQVAMQNTDNPSVKATLETLEGTIG